MVRFYVGEVTTETPQTVKIYTDSSTSVDVQVSEGNKWYTYVLPKDKGLYGIESGIYDYNDEEWTNGIVTKTVIKANISYYYDGNFERYNGMIPWGITEVSFKGSDTSNVTDMDNMFYGCSGLTSLDLRNFNTSNVTYMGYMFQDCRGLTSLDVSSFDTSNVTKMNSMFSGCSGLTSLDLSSFNTSNVTNMNSMFSGCSGLTSLDLSGCDTSKLEYTSYMFSDCSGLESLDLSGWYMGHVTDRGNMFKGCSALKTIRMVGCGSTTVEIIRTQLIRGNITGVTIVTE